MTDEPFDAAAHFDDSLAARYERRIRLFCPSYDALHRMIAPWLRRLPENSTFLSVGCGTGAEMVALGERFLSWRFVGVDISSEMLAACEKKLAAAGIANRAALFNGRLQDYEAPAPFDAASSVFVAHFIAGRDEKLSYFRSVASRLKPGGIFVLADLFGEKGSPEFERLSDAWLQSYASNDIAAEELAADRAHIESDIDFITEAELVALLREAGFDSVVRFYQTFLFGGWIAAKRSPTIYSEPDRAAGQEAGGQIEEMRTTYLPRVAAAEHATLARIVDNYPADTYEKWMSLQAKEIANWQRSGWNVVLIDVGADDFIRYCRETRASPNFHTFRGIASAKAIGKFR